MKKNYSPDLGILTALEMIGMFWFRTIHLKRMYDIVELLA